jgi:hypothetical protein
MSVAVTRTPLSGIYKSAINFLLLALHNRVVYRKSDWLRRHQFKGVCGSVLIQWIAFMGNFLCVSCSDTHISELYL